MSFQLASLAVLTLSGSVVAQPQEGKMPPPKVVSYSGKRIAAFEYGKTDPVVKVGDLTFRLLPLLAADDRAQIGYEVENRTDNTVRMADFAPKWSGDNVSTIDSTSITYKVDRDIPPGGLQAGRELAPRRGHRSTFTLVQQFERAAITLSIDVPAPPGDVADRWRVVFPRTTWVKRWPAYEPQLRAEAPR